MQMLPLTFFLLVIFKCVEPATLNERGALFDDSPEGISTSIKEAEKQVEALVKSFSKIAMKYFTRNSDLKISSSCRSSFFKIFLDLRKLKPPVIKCK